MNSKKSALLQFSFLQSIKDVMDPNLSFVDELADLLGISRDSVYRRLRNETSLSLSEIMVLSEHFKVVFDLNQQVGSGAVGFSYQPMRKQADYKQYLLSLAKDLGQILHAQERLITYAANDIPIFYHFHFPDLTAFKIFYWLKGVIHDPDLVGKKFDQSLIDPDIIALTNELAKAYSIVPSREIWTVETVNSQLEQIRYYWESGQFQDRQSALTVCRQAKESYELLNKQAERGSKTLEGKPLKNFWLYYSEIEIGNNTIMVDRGGKKLLYISFNTFNTLVTANELFCNEVDGWMQNLIKKSTLISEVSEKVRFQFFQTIGRKVEALIKEIENA